MTRRVVVTGVGVVTPLSCQVDDLWNRLLLGESGIHSLSILDTTDFKVKFGGDVQNWDPSEYIDHKEGKRIDRFTQFAVVACVDAVNDCGIDFEKEESFRCGVVL
ncbi:MAG TPA: beta-ketoacyl-[acyl-carrier-protein] synthase II, partial [Planctomycetes bacterium]|nr:beta-ketoacyl-[acyl-carrier-protein] synthase II [Planctomycetota bacterium]